MGQYFKAVLLDDKKDTIKGFLRSWDFNSGVKLMEHSWMLSPFMQAVEKQLSPLGDHHKSRLVWAGDYADHESESELNLYSMCDENKHIQCKTDENMINYHFIVNHTKKQYIDKRDVIDMDGWRVHPLSLFTCEGNGRGGGDYDDTSDDHHNLIGSWARDVISIEEVEPVDFIKIKSPFYEN